MLTEAAQITVIPHAPTSGACELCGAESAARGSAVVVQHARGGQVRFVVCERCSLAMKRLAAAAGGSARFTAGETAAAEPETRAAAPVPEPGRAAQYVEVVAPVVAGDDVTSGPAVLVREAAGLVRGGNGVLHTVRVYGAPRADGTWIGWVEFAAEGTGSVVRTPRETTQPNREAVEYWAAGLEPIYFEGAFARAR